MSIILIKTIIRGRPCHQQERRRLDDLRKKGQRRFDEDGTKIYPTGGGILRLRRAGRASTNSLAHCRTRGKVSADPGNFHRLVKDTVTQDDPAKAVADMRSAIKNTNVVLNMVISPGLILVPSDLTILKEKVADYNNVLTLATKEMKFGLNEGVNYVKPKPVETRGSPQGPQNGSLGETPPKKQEGTISTRPQSGVAEILPRSNGTPYLLGSAVALGFLVARYVI